MVIICTTVDNCEIGWRRRRTTAAMWCCSDWMNQEDHSRENIGSRQRSVRCKEKDSATVYNINNSKCGDEVEQSPCRLCKSISTQAAGIIMDQRYPDDCGTEGLFFDWGRWQHTEILQISYSAAIHPNSPGVSVTQPHLSLGMQPPAPSFLRDYTKYTRNEDVPKIIKNDTIIYFFSKCNQHFANFKP